MNLKNIVHILIASLFPYGAIEPDLLCAANHKGATMKILIIGGNKALAHSISHELGEAHSKIRYVRDGDLGLEIALNDNFDLLVLDWSSPKKDGLIVMRELREQKNMTPILMLAGGESLRDVTLSLDSHADACVSNPIDINDVIPKMKALMGRSKRNQYSHPDINLVAVGETQEVFGPLLTTDSPHKPYAEDR